jgi:hypothetical protein
MTNTAHPLVADRTDLARYLAPIRRARPLFAFGITSETVDGCEFTHLPCGCAYGTRRPYRPRQVATCALHTPPPAADPCAAGHDLVDDTHDRQADGPVRVWCRRPGCGFVTHPQLTVGA